MIIFSDIVTFCYITSTCSVRLKRGIVFVNFALKVLNKTGKAEQVRFLSELKSKVKAELEMYIVFPC